MDKKTYTESEILNRMVFAARRFKLEGERGIAWEFMQMSDREKLAFDLFLVRTRDPLAYEAGTVEYRFWTRVKRMAGVPA